MLTLCGYGHSWAFGTGATKREKGFVALTSRALDASLDNRAVSGTLSTDTVTLVSQQPPPPADIFVLMTGFNDARLHGGSTEALAAYSAAVHALLREFQRANAAALIFAMEQPHILDYSQHAPYDKGSSAVVDRYNSALRAEIEPHPLARSVAVDDWDPARMLADDTVHPNDLGHAHLANALVRMAERTPGGSR